MSEENANRYGNERERERESVGRDGGNELNYSWRDVDLAEKDKVSIH